MDPPFKLRKGNSPTEMSDQTVIMKSGQSMDCQWEFNATDASSKTQEIPVFHKLSCLSLKSEQSQHRDWQFREEDFPADLCSQNHRESLPSRGGDCSTDLGLSQRERSDSPTSNCTSIKRDDSMNSPWRNFREGGPFADMSIKEERPNLSSGKTFESVFKEVENRTISVIKNELKKFKMLLNPDNPGCSGREMEDVSGQSSISEWALKITLQVLKEMKLSYLATTLQTRIAPLSVRKLKSNLRKKSQSINEGIPNYGTSTLLNEIYTELYITEGDSGEVNNEHEVRQIEKASRIPTTQEIPINCNDIFTPLPGQDKSIRTVLTKGVAGIGKTVSVQKFILDWAEGKANQYVHMVFPLPFRELNLMKDESLSLMKLLHHFFPETKELGLTDFTEYKSMFIFDGLDECRLPLDFQNNDSLFELTEKASVDVLLTNLIKGNLVPSALIWITSRPAACGQIPPECVDQITEVRGFNDLQKEEYFRKRISDQSLANRIITHMKSSRSLYIMCHIPVFSWIAGTVLQNVCHEDSTEVPRTLTQMFAHFLIYQIKHSKQKYPGKTDSDPDQTRTMVWTLGKLAFQQLEKGNLIFYEEDLRECGIDVREVSVYSGLCTQIFRKEFGLHMGKVYSFVHLSIQEFLAALFVFLSFLTSNRKAFEKQVPGFVISIHKPAMSDLLKSAVDKALQSKNGHLDLFLLFLLGLSLESNQALLRGLLPQTSRSSHKEEMVKYIKKKIKENPSPEKSINLFHCLNELNDHSLVQEVQTYLCRKGKNRLSARAVSTHLTGVSLSSAQWSALVFVLLSSEVDLKEFNLSKFDPSEQCFQRLLPAVKASRKANLSGCSLTEKSCAILASALTLNSTSLRELDLSSNNLQDKGVKLLSDGLEHPHCKLETLRLCGCSLTEKSCSILAFVLSSNVSVLKELNLGNNNLQDSGVKLLCEGLESPQCKLEELGLHNCSITAEGCSALASALKSNPSHLTNLSLGINRFGDSGVKLLSFLLRDPRCKLEKLELNDCSVTEEGCAALALALKSNPSHLRELGLSYNQPGDLGLKLLTDLLKDPHCKLEKLELYN